MTRCLITAGPTHEALDAVRYIGNRSSGKMGIAIAEAARDGGWDVTLLLGPVCAAAPRGVRVECFVSASDLATLLDRHFPACDVLVMAAAVGDYRPLSMAGGKLTRSLQGLTLELEATPDLVAECGRRKTGQRILGFALEEAGRLNERATRKLKDKNLDAIVANPLDTMDSPRIDARIITVDGRQHEPPSSGPMEKAEFARWLVGWIARSWDL